MFHYFVTFSATIDDLESKFGTYGVVIPNPDRDIAEYEAERQTKERAGQTCRKAYPEAKQITIVIINLQEVSGEGGEVPIYKGFNP